MEANTLARHPDHPLALASLGMALVFSVVFAVLGALYWASLGPPPAPPVFVTQVPRVNPQDFRSCPPMPDGVACCPELDGVAYARAVDEAAREVGDENDALARAYDQERASRQRALVVIAGSLGMMGVVVLLCGIWVRRTRPRRPAEAHRSALETLRS